MDRTSQFEEFVVALSKKSNVDTSQKQNLKKEDGEHTKVYGYCKKLARDIRSLELFLKNNSGRYLSFNQLFSFDNSMSNKERDRVDGEARASILDFRRQIKTLRTNIEQISTNNDMQAEHVQGILKFLDDYVLTVESTSNHLRKLRRKNQQQSQNDYLSKAPKIKKSTISSPISLPPPPVPLEENLLKLDEEQTKMLTLENQNLHTNFGKQLDQIGQQVTNIKELAIQLQERVEHETETLPGILEQSIQANNSIRRGNENLQLLKADSKDLRLFLLTLLIFMSLSLLFLHWVNP